ncbi:MAG: DUF4838 domain-containing protein [Lentisphaerae bacterium]|nr:DUF4838 domain-containing protein [Lentisphaerota bacterium]MBT4818665.1 DUF4838 domain-containing protein [Lentisphaerota bacterium]MBT5610197.1 DUF4838 domain-containing protein [Lentisphaerota bacterium]MBT7057070.1 DUF4838 domain-containing protein [Lentisphaerota bacterium]MBT7846207.1 DUF4838 domain-containing protein [Lentisphaerota bacterium]
MVLSRRQSVWLTLVAATITSFGPRGALAQGPGRSARQLRIVKDGTAKARIVVSARPSGKVLEAAAVLAETLQESTGALLPTVRGDTPSAPGIISIHCGRTSYVQGLKLDLDSLDLDGFVISFPDATNIVLAGPADWGVEYAVYEFLERHIGVRWLFPGPLGKVVPKRRDLTVAASDIREQPAFKHRLFSGLGRTEEADQRGQQALWARRNRMHGRVKFHHNLWRLFPPETTTDSHPELFPVLKGERFLPVPPEGKTTAQDTHTQVCWQPCFTAQGSASEAARRISEYFDKTSDATSYSLGINDSNQYCTCATCTAVDGGGKNVIGVQNVSTSYYRWCNAIAQGLEPTHPDKLLGLLAYNGAYSPPQGFQLDDQIVPFITYDRMKWAAPHIERGGKSLTEDWSRSARVLGWYDYIYGGQFYLAPRVYFHRMADYLRYGYANNVRHYYAEAYPSTDWHEGPKLYVALKLLWDPSRDVDRILDDWYAAAVGPKAAPFLGRYFRLWEEFWTGPVLKTGWFKRNGNRQYLDFGSSAYLEAFTKANLQTCIDLLATTVQKAPAGPERQRAQYIEAGLERRLVELRSLVRMRNPTGVTVVKNVEDRTFDQGLDSWGYWQRGYSKAVFSTDADTGHRKPGSLRVDAANSQKSPLCFTRAIPIRLGATYRASVWFRAEALGPDATVSVVIKWKDADSKWISIASAENGTQAPFPKDWRQLKVHVDTGTRDTWAKVHYAMLLITVDRTPSGKVWFDDFKFDEVNIPE